MKQSLIPSGIAETLLRPCRFVLPAILILGAAAANAQIGGPVGQLPGNRGANTNSNSLVGQWRGVYRGITLTMVIQPNGQYTQTAQSGSVMTLQSGTYKLIPPNTIGFVVIDWQPKTMSVYHPTGTVGGYYTQEPLAKPPGSVDTYVFKGANTVVFTDQMMHGSITFTRVP